MVVEALLDEHEELLELIRRYFEALRLYESCGFNDPNKHVKQKILFDIRDRLYYIASKGA